MAVSETQIVEGFVILLRVRVGELGRKKKENGDDAGVGLSSLFSNFGIQIQSVNLMLTEGFLWKLGCDITFWILHSSFEFKPTMECFTEAFHAASDLQNAAIMSVYICKAIYILP